MLPPMCSDTATTTTTICEDYNDDSPNGNRQPGGESCKIPQNVLHITVTSPHEQPPKLAAISSAALHPCGMDEDAEEQIVFTPKRGSGGRTIYRPATIEFFTSVLKLGTRDEQQLAKLAVVIEHPSSNFTDKAKQIEFQRQEWLGDTILQFLVSKLLMHKFPKESESQLNVRRTAIVRENNLAAWGRSVGFDKCLLVKGQVTDGIIADSVEALIGVLFQEFGGLTAVEPLCAQLVEFESSQVSTVTNAKSILQDWCVAALGRVPKFTFKSHSGPDHRPTFHVDVSVEFQEGGSTTVTVNGEGTTKQKAEEDACGKLFSTKSIVLQDLPIEVNIKGRLQEMLGGATVEYRLLPELGPINAPFQVQLKAKTHHQALFAFGATKKQAENQAAYAMIKLLSQTNAATTSTGAPPAYRDDEDTKSISSSSTSEWSRGGSYDNSKGRLQELVLRSGSHPMPTYRLKEIIGPDHAPSFTMEVWVGNKMWGEGTQRTKKQAEEAAASMALQNHTMELETSAIAPALPMSQQDIANPKGYLQERALKVLRAVPAYKELAGNQPGYFACEVYVNGAQQGAGKGTSKKEAEIMAARAAIVKLNL